MEILTAMQFMDSVSRKKQLVDGYHQDVKSKDVCYPSFHHKRKHSERGRSVFCIFCSTSHAKQKSVDILARIISRYWTKSEKSP